MTITIVSNHMGPNGTSIDRLYGSPASGGTLRLIQKDYSTYKGSISKKATTIKAKAKKAKTKAKAFSSK